MLCRIPMRMLFVVLMGSLLLAACDTTDPEPEPEPLNVRLAADIEADPTSGRDPETGAPISNNLFTLYDLEAGEVVLSSSETDAAVRQQDSVSTVWDIGFRGTTIIFNGGTSGPGDAVAQLLAVPFADVTEAPADGYVADGENTCPAVQTPAGPVPGPPYAICTGSDNGWYNYNPQNNLIAPIPGRTIVLRSASGNYAKLRILSYYKGNPDPPDPTAPSRYYTFEYVLQPDGSRDLTTE
ncbi:MAG: hypothetical protein D6685_06335 [Bacteroidetes bacterium]|nr:MAG: hypothetical protein D6685_06335 [Bacteroidota bacterium]